MGDPDILDDTFVSPGKNQFSRLTGVFLVLQLLALFLSNAIAFYEMETILFSGPLVVVSALILIILGVLHKERLPLIMGSYSIILAAILFLLIYFYQMGPSMARKKLLVPWTIVNSPFLLLWTVLTWRFLARKNGSPA